MFEPLAVTFIQSFGFNNAPVTHPCYGNIYLFYMYILVWHMSWLYVQVHIHIYSYKIVKTTKKLKKKLNFRSDRRPFHSPFYM